MFPRCKQYALVQSWPIILSWAVSYARDTSRSLNPCAVYDVFSLLHYSIICEINPVFNESTSSTLPEKSRNTEFFLVRIFPIWTKYGDLRSKSPYSVQILENTDQKKLCIWTLFAQCYIWIWWWHLTSSWRSSLSIEM